MAKLKVFRTAIGFHDAYVAAPSKKAALAAWGTSKDLFARGAAEVVTDPELTARPLEQPGVVLKLSRGSAAEHMTALPKSDGTGRAAKTKTPAAKARPRPDRSALDAARAALDAAETRHRADVRELAERIAALEKQKRGLDAQAERERAKLEAAVAKAEDRYEHALERWRGE